MGKKHHAELREIKYYCSKCDRTYLYTPDEVEFNGWTSDGLIPDHGGVTMSFMCKGCKNFYFITLNEY